MFQNDNAPVKRLCFPAVQHVREPETIRLYDAVIVNSEDGSRNIGKIARIFLDDSTGNSFSKQSLVEEIGCLSMPLGPLVLFFIIRL